MALSKIAQLSIWSILLPFSYKHFIFAILIFLTLSKPFWGEWPAAFTPTRAAAVTMNRSVPERMQLRRLPQAPRGCRSALLSRRVAQALEL